MKRITETDLGIWIISVIPSLSTYFTIYKSMNNTIDLTPHIPYLLSIGVLFISVGFFYIRRWVLTQLRKLNELKYLRIKLKYYDIMLTKFSANNSAHPFHVFENDMILFSEDEKEILNAYFKDQEKLRTIMKGKNLI